MKNLLRIALSLAALALAWSPARAETSDPPPILAESATPFDDSQFVGLFDLADGNCANGVCLAARGAVASSPASFVPASSSACGSVATARRYRPIRSTFERIQSWYPGKAFATIRSARTAFGGR